MANDIDTRTRADETLLSAFGRTRRLSEWVALPGCKITANQLLSRLRAGYAAEQAITLTTTPVDRLPDTIDARRRPTGYYGVSKKGSRFAARVRVGGRILNLGIFEHAVQAAIAYDRAVELMPHCGAARNFEALEDLPKTTLAT